MKKNCRHLEWGFGDIGDPEGYMCNKRDYFQSGNSEKAESDHLKQLDKDSYLEKSKLCCDLKLIEDGKRFCFDYKGNKVFQGDTVEYYSLTNCRGDKNIGIIKCIGDMNEKQINMPYIIGEGAYCTSAILKVSKE